MCIKNRTLVISNWEYFCWHYYSSIVNLFFSVLLTFFFLQQIHSSKNKMELNLEQVLCRRAEAKTQLLSQWKKKPGHPVYLINCTCFTQFCCLPMPTLKLIRCLRVGELDYFYVEQPFLTDYGFTLRWHCANEDCQSEVCCGSGP